MSASLVGSEMCIRDRNYGYFDLLGIRPSCFRGRVVIHSGGTGGSTAEGLPVSYTHLTLPTICSV
eukprot:2000152-Alexandrium_andersonii.AAC.1